MSNSDAREGLVGIDGRWWTPEEVHAWCAKRMAAFDGLRREARDLINENGGLKPHEIKSSHRRYLAYLKSYTTS